MVQPVPLERMHERVSELDADSLVRLTTEDMAMRIANSLVRLSEQSADSFCASDHGGNRRRGAVHVSEASAKSHHSPEPQVTVELVAEPEGLVRLGQGEQTVSSPSAGRRLRVAWRSTL